MAVEVAGKMAAHAVADVAEHAAEDVVAHAAEDVGEKVAESCALSFAPDTHVATPSGGVAIASLHIGDHVTAYDPTTGKISTQTVQHVWINHDTDLIDVTLRVADQHVASSDAKARRATVAAHGLRAPPSDATDGTDVAAGTATATHDELIHTTAKHPWLTTDRGFVLAGTLHAGERVVREDGTPATVVVVAVRPGAADYYNLTVSVLHTYAVGVGRYVVHNCGGIMGKLEGQSIKVTEKGLAKVESHLATVDLDNGENAMMVNRLRTALDEGQRVTGADANYYMHELAESTKVAQGMTRDAAHLEAIAKYGVDARSLYHPDVIQTFGHELFNQSWFNFWGIR